MGLIAEVLEPPSTPLKGVRSSWLIVVRWLLFTLIGLLGLLLGDRQFAGAFGDDIFEVVILLVKGIKQQIIGAGNASQLVVAIFR